MQIIGRYSRLAAALVVIGFSIATSVGAASNATSVRIDNFGRVNTTYYRGAQPEGRDYADLATLGVRTIINLTNDDAQPNEPAMARQVGLKYFQIPMTTHTPPTPLQLTEFLNIVNEPANQPVYVHCVGGRHRTGVMTAVYRMTNENWSSDQAFHEMKQYKYGPDFMHSEFKQFVYAFPSQVKALTANTGTK